MTSITEIVASSTVPEAERAVLVASLVERENIMADQLRSLGQQFGLYPEIVAESLASVGMGSPLDETTRAYVRQQFVDLMERLRQGQQGPTPPPDGSAGV